jgi:hypothetical protein
VALALPEAIVEPLPLALLERPPTLLEPTLTGPPRLSEVEDEWLLVPPVPAVLELLWLWLNPSCGLADTAPSEAPPKLCEVDPPRAFEPLSRPPALPVDCASAGAAMSAREAPAMRTNERMSFPLWRF